MNYQKNTKELLVSCCFIVPPIFIEQLEGLYPYGTATRADSGVLRNFGQMPTHFSVYRPDQLQAGELCGIRLLQKSFKGGMDYKIVIIPIPDTPENIGELMEYDTVIQTLIDFGFSMDEWKEAVLD